MPASAVLASHARATVVCVTEVVCRSSGAVGPEGLVGGSGEVGGGGDVGVVVVVVVGGGGGDEGVEAHAAVDTVRVACEPTLPLLSTPATAYS